NDPHTTTRMVRLNVAANVRAERRHKPLRLFWDAAMLFLLDPNLLTENKPGYIQRTVHTVHHSWTRPPGNARGLRRDGLGEKRGERAGRRRLVERMDLIANRLDQPLWMARSLHQPCKLRIDVSPRN